jgi:predicted aspartyl protease
MIRGYFVSRGGRRRPFVDGNIEFPTLGRTVKVGFLVDTGADRTILSPPDARRLTIDPSAFQEGVSSTGVGGTMPTRVANVYLSIGAFSTPLTLTILNPPAGTPLSPIPSLLGRDVLSRFALFVEERTDRVLLLSPDEADALHLP